MNDIGSVIDEAIKALAAGKRGEAARLLDQVVLALWERDRAAALAELAEQGRAPGHYNRRCWHNIASDGRIRVEP